MWACYSVCVVDTMLSITEILLKYSVHFIWNFIILELIRLLYTLICYHLIRAN